MLAAAVATGVAATGVSYFSEAVPPAAQSTSMAPMVVSTPSPRAFATPNRLLEAATGHPALSTGAAAQANSAAVARPAGPSAVPEAQSRPAVPQRVARVRVSGNDDPSRIFRHPTSAVVGDRPATFVTAAGPAVNPIGILGAAFAVFVSNGDEPGENGGLLIGNGADGGPGQDGGNGGLLFGNGGRAVMELPPSTAAVPAMAATPGWSAAMAATAATSPPRTTLSPSAVTEAMAETAAG